MQNNASAEPEASPEPETSSLQVPPFRHAHDAIGVDVLGPAVEVELASVADKLVDGVDVDDDDDDDVETTISADVVVVTKSTVSQRSPVNALGQAHTVSSGAEAEPEPEPESSSIQLPPFKHGQAVELVV